MQPAAMESNILPLHQSYYCLCPFFITITTGHCKLTSWVKERQLMIMQFLKNLLRFYFPKKKKFCLRSDQTRDHCTAESASQPFFICTFYFRLKKNLGRFPWEKKSDPDVISTRNHLVWSQTRYRCTTESLLLECALQPNVPALEDLEQLWLVKFWKVEVGFDFTK